MAHEYRKTVRFGDCDPANIVYYPRLFHFCHLAMEDFFESALDLPYVELIEGRRTGFPAVHLDADFQSTMPFGEELRIHVSVLRLGTKSMTWRYRFQGPGGEERAEIRVVTACVDMGSFQAQPIPEDLRAQFEEYLEVSPAGE